METSVLNPIPEKEFERVLELSELDLDYSSLDEHFSDLTKLAAKVAGTDISLINLIDSFTQWSIANYGLPVDQTPREESVCQYTIVGDEPLEIKDLSRDNRFKEKDYVRKDPKLRFYYGIPLKTDDGNNIGTLCVLDDDSKHLTPEKVEMLKIIADEIVNRLFDLKVMSDMKKEITEANESKRKLSHDLRGPIGGIIGLAQIIEDQGDDNKMKEILELAELIRKGGESVLELADEILSKNKEEQERIPSENEFNLNTLKEKLEQLYPPQAASKDIDLTIANHSENEGIPFPKNKILQIVGNLISNAIKFTPKGGMVMVRQEFAKNDQGASHLLFVVKDTGKGISEKKINDILEGEAKSSNGTDGEVGYGFGLSLVKHLVDKMEGKIEVTSDEGKGCKFDITLPVKRK